MQNFGNVWIRVAGHAQRIKSGDRHPWRCFVDPDLTEIPIVGWTVTGVATMRNYVTETNASGDERGLVAWVRCFGTLTLGEDHVAHIALATPPGG